jgi:hypothetical protein
MSMTTDLTTLENNTADKQSVGYTPGAGATDPGDEPIGDPIPVGDGWVFLLVLVATYAGWKRIKL